MAEAPKILLVEGERGPIAELARRLCDLYPGVECLGTVDEAIRRLADAESPGVVFFSTQRPPAELEAVIGSIRRAGRRTGARFVGVGQRPTKAERSGLLSAGVEICLWEPIGDAQLRFAVNQAGYEPAEERPRGGARVPTAMVARIVTATGEKEAHVYSLSAGGAYLETSRPTMTGGRMKIELPLPDGNVVVEARSVYHNVGGNLLQENLAVGMGVEFVDVDLATHTAIADYVDEYLELQTGQRPPKRTPPPSGLPPADEPEPEAPPEERRRHPRLGFLRLERLRDALGKWTTRSSRSTSGREERRPTR